MFLELRELVTEKKMSVMFILLIKTYHVVDENSLARSQCQTKQICTKPENVCYSGQCVIAYDFLGKEYRAVENQDQDNNLAAESGDVADHHKLVSVLDGLSQRLVATSKFSDAALELTAAADGALEISVQCAELVVEDASDYAVH